MKRVPAHRRKEEGGYILVLLAGSMTVLLSIAGLAVDLGWWYREATKLQSAVDAAALAGVVYMPGNLSKASATAMTTMAKNDFANGANGVVVTVSVVPGYSRRLKVCATDSDVEVYFTKVVGMDPIITKCAVAEYILPVAMGSPLNEMSQSTLGVWPAINGHCSATEDGDEVLSAHRGMFPDHTWSTFTGCPPGGVNGPPLGPNPSYDATGYNYIVDVKTAAATSIQVYDGAWHAAAGTIDGNQGTGATLVDTTFKITWDNATPLDTGDDVLVSTTMIPSRSLAYRSAWVTLYTAGAIGRYNVNVTVSTNATSHGSNSFGLRAGSGAFALCSSELSAVNYSATCPEVFADQHLGVNAQVASSVASFYLADVDSVYAGRTMTVGLFDPGEGGSTIEILDPNGNPVSFTYATVDDLPATAGALAYSGSGTAIDVSGTVTRPTYRRNAWKFNDRKVEAVVDLPANYTALYGTKTWWKLRYTFGSGSVSDRTTWDVGITGDPVRLVLG